MNESGEDKETRVETDTGTPRRDRILRSGGGGGCRGVSGRGRHKPESDTSYLYTHAVAALLNQVKEAREQGSCLIHLARAKDGQAARQNGEHSRMADKGGKLITVFETFEYLAGAS